MTRKFISVSLILNLNQLKYMALFRFVRKYVRNKGFTQIKTEDSMFVIFKKNVSD